MGENHLLRSKEQDVKIVAGTKVTCPMPDGRRLPGVALTEAEGEKVIVINKTTKQPVEITVTRFTVITYRETREGTKYLALTQEVGNYGYRVVAEPRFSTIVGLDATEDGEKMTLDALVEAHGASFSEWSAARFAERNGTVAADDL